MATMDATMDQVIPQHRDIAEAPRDLNAIAQQERAHILAQWDATVAFQLGCALRTRLLTFEKPTVIHISTVSEPGHVLFHSVSTCTPTKR
jgi:uncharacterized protein (UPF0303 family)